MSETDRDAACRRARRPDPARIIEQRLSVIEQGARHYEVTARDYEAFAEESETPRERELFFRLARSMRAVAACERGAYADALRGVGPAAEVVAATPAGDQLALGGVA